MVLFQPWETFLGQCTGRKIISVLVKKIDAIRDWPEDFLSVMMVALPKKNQANKCSDPEQLV